MLRTLVIIDNLNVGGIATSLYNFLNYACDKMNIELLVFDYDSIDFKRLPQNVVVLKNSKFLKILGMSQADIKQDSKMLFIFRAFLVVLARFAGGHISRKILFSLVKTMQGYDVAISYAHDDPWKALTKGCNDFVLNKVSAKYKMGFVHCDYQNFGGYDARQEVDYKKMDNIVCVSESCKDGFLKMFPSLEAKVCVCENFIDVRDIQHKAEEKIPCENTEVVFVSVCRLSVVKGLDRAIRAFSRLYQEGNENFKWIIVGDGPESIHLKNMVLEHHLGDNIQFVGEKKNPYGYMKEANVFLLPSVHEAAPMVFGECAVLGVPILTTQTCSADELVAQRGLGMVCKNDEEGIYQGLKMVLERNGIRDIKKIPSNQVNENAEKQLDELIRNVEFYIKHERDV